MGPQPSVLNKKRQANMAIPGKKKEDVLLAGVSAQSQVWMSHADTILALARGI